MDYIIIVLCALLAAAVFAAVALALLVRDLRREVTRLEARIKGWMAAYWQVQRQRDELTKGDE